MHLGALHSWVPGSTVEISTPGHTLPVKSRFVVVVKMVVVGVSQEVSSVVLDSYDSLVEEVSSEVSVVV